MFQNFAKMLYFRGFTIKIKKIKKRKFSNFRYVPKTSLQASLPSKRH